MKRSRAYLIALAVLVLVIGGWQVANYTQVHGTAANGSPVAGNPVLICGTDGTNCRALSTDATGKLIAIGPQNWSASSSPAAGSQSLAQRAAGGAGVKHVANCVSFSASAVVAPALTAVSLQLFDNATVVWNQSIALSATTGTLLGPFSVCGLNIVGTANTTMTAEWSAAVANVSESAVVTGFDIQ